MQDAPETPPPSVSRWVIVSSCLLFALVGLWGVTMYVVFPN